MDKFRLHPAGGGLQFGSHLEGLNESARTAMAALRNFTLSLGNNVIEEVRPHRVVYAKTLTFRTFLDIEPAADHLIVSIKSSRKIPPAIATIRTLEDAESIKEQIARAFQNIQ